MENGIVNVDTDSLGESEENTDCYCTEGKRLARASKLHRKNAFGLQNINHPPVSIPVTRRIHGQTVLPTAFLILEYLTELRGQWPYILPSYMDQTQVSEMCLILSYEAPAGKQAALNKQSSRPDWNS